MEAAVDSLFSITLLNTGLLVRVSRKLVRCPSDWKYVSSCSSCSGVSVEAISRQVLLEKLLVQKATVCVPHVMYVFPSPLAGPHIPSEWAAPVTGGEGGVVMMWSPGAARVSTSDDPPPKSELETESELKLTKSSEWSVESPVVDIEAVKKEKIIGWAKLWVYKS